MTSVPEPAADLGFVFRSHKDGAVEILSRGKRVAILRKREAAKFLSNAAFADDGEMQHLMARVTGNFRRGNERAARRHRRNRG